MKLESNMFGHPSLKAILVALKEIEGAAGLASAPRSNLRKVIELLERSEASTVPELVAALEITKQRKPKKAAPKPANQEIVARYLDRLQAARSNPQEFKRAVDDLFLDKGARLAQEIRQIANKYTGGSLAFKTKLAAREAIERKYQGRWVADQYSLKAS